MGMSPRDAVTGGAGATLAERQTHASWSEVCKRLSVDLDLVQVGIDVYSEISEAAQFFRHVATFTLERTQRLPRVERSNRFCSLATTVQDAVANNARAAN